MSAHRRYRFQTEAQWRACLFLHADIVSGADSRVVRPLSPYARAGSVGAQATAAPAVTRVGERLWRDGDGHLMRMPAGDEAPRVIAAPHAIANAQRIVVTHESVWVARRSPGCVFCFDLETLTLRFTVPIDDSQVIDIAGDGKEGIFVLVEREQCFQGVRFDCAGRPADTVPLAGLVGATELVYLRGVEQFVVLCQEGRELWWYPKDGGERRSWIVVAALGHCFKGTHLGRDAHGRLLLTGRDGKAQPEWRLMVLAGDGALLQDLPVDAEPTGVAAGRAMLYVTTGAGLLRFASANAVPARNAEVVAALVTPMLRSPDTEDGRRWLRIEATAKLPPGTTIEIAYAASDDLDQIARMQAIAGDLSLPPGHRVSRLGNLAGVWSNTTAFHGPAQVQNAAHTVAVPIFDERRGNLWVSLALIAPPGAELPELTKLEVLYPGPTLMDNLPAIYRRDAAKTGSFLRSLVGVLETTTQDLDARIASLGSYIHPDTASGDWLDYVARWLGLPWDDALSLAQKRCIAKHAAQIARGRGTRTGLEQLLACLLPETSAGVRRYRVVDATADYGIAMVGSKACRGSTLPAMLAGFAAPAAELGTRLVLGSVRLPCPDAPGDDDSAYLVGRIRVDVTATGEQRRDWSPWFKALLSEMVPMSASLALRWLPPGALGPNDDEITLADDPAPSLGTDTVIGVARLPDRESPLSHPGTGFGGPLH